MKGKGNFLAMALMGLGMVFLAGCEAKGPSGGTRVSGTAMGWTVIEAAPERVYEYMYGEEGNIVEGGTVVHKWAPWLSATDIQGAGVGLTNKLTLEVAGRKFKSDGTLIDWDPDQGKGMAKWAGDVDATITLLWQPHDQGTKLILINEYSFDLPEGAGVSKDALIKEMDQLNNNALKMVKEGAEKLPTLVSTGEKPRASSGAAMKSVVIPAPPETVFKWMLAHVPEWGFGQTSNWQGEGVGSTHEWTYEAGGKVYHSTSVFTEFVPNQRVIEHTVGDIESNWNWILAPHQGGTKVLVVFNTSRELPALAKDLEESLNKLKAGIEK